MAGGPAGSARVHLGPAVAPGEAGPARFVTEIYEAFDAGAALALAGAADRFYRTPGGEGYDVTLDALAARLRAAGFGHEESLELEFLEYEMDDPAWTPLAARVVLHVEGAEPVTLHAFSESHEVDRVMLPINTPAANVEGPPVFSLDEVEPGTVLVMDAAPSKSILARAERRGAVAVLSSALFSFSVDPTGAERHLDAVLFTKVEPGTSIPVATISARSHERIRAAASSPASTPASEGPRVRVALMSEVRFGGRTARVLKATIVGAGRADEVVAIVSHAQEPGAGDNASGIAGMTESACTLARLLREERLERPARTIVFVWGDEMSQTHVFLDSTERRVIAGISADMLGQSPERTGAIALLERSPDPGALQPLPPDEHTPWGAAEVDERDIRPSGVALIARIALSDVGRRVGGWRTSENPWEGGSDHDVFLERRIPAVLIWHFTDFTYHTSLDRMEMLDGEELRRTCTAVLATALALADSRPGDLERYLASNELERNLRRGAAEAASEPELAARWDEWCLGTERWLRDLCSVE